MKTIAITGATGTVGSYTLRALRDADLEVKALVRDPNKLEVSIRESVEVRDFDFFKPEKHPETLKDIDQLLLVSPEGNKDLESFLLDAHKGGIDHIILLSGMGADVNDKAPLRKAELSLEKAGVPYTCLRLNWFMQNFVNYFSGEIRDHHRITLPAGDSLTSFVDVRDIADVVVKLFVEATPENRAYTITGQEALSYHDVAGYIGEAIDKEVIYTPLSDEEAKKKFLESGWGEKGTREMIRLFRDIRGGVSAPVSNDVETILGRPQRCFKDFVKDYKETWRSA